MRARLAVLLLAALYAPAQESVQRLYERARLLQERNRDLLEAARLYREVVARSKSERALAARAQFELGKILERLGRSDEAKRSFRAVVTDFADQSDIAALARRKLGGRTLHGMTTRQIWKGEDVGLYMGVSPDGRVVAYTAQSGDLALHDNSTGEDRQLTHKPNGGRGQAMYPVFSPDGKEVAYFWSETSSKGGEIRAIALGSSASPRVLWSTNPNQVVWLLDWSPDGKYIGGVVIDGNSILLIPAAGGQPRIIHTRQMPSERVAFSPDSRYVVYDNCGPSGSADIYIQPLDGGAPKSLIQHAAVDTVVGWDPSGRSFLFISDRTGTAGLWEVPYADGAVHGPATLIKDGLGRIFPLRVTRQGSLYYGLNAGFQDVYTIDLDTVKPAVLSPPKPVAQRFIGANGDPSWSPDGKYLTYVADRGAAGNVIVLHDTGRGTDTELRPDLLDFTHPRWTPNGRALSLIGSAADSAGIYHFEPFSRAVTLEIKDGEFPVYFGMVPSWSPDGKRYFLKDNKRGVFVFDVATRRETLLYPVPRERVIAPNDPVVSPDGNLIAFNTWRVPHEQMLVVVPATGGAPRELMTLAEPERFAYGGAFAWTNDSRQLIVARGTNFKFDLWRISVDTGAAAKIGLNTFWMRYLALHPDGKQLAYQAGVDDWELWAIDNFLPTGSGH